MTGLSVKYYLHNLIEISTLDPHICFQISILLTPQRFLKLSFVLSGLLFWAVPSLFSASHNRFALSETYFPFEILALEPTDNKAIDKRERAELAKIFSAVNHQCKQNTILYPGGHCVAFPRTVGSIYSWTNITLYPEDRGCQLAPR